MSDLVNRWLVGLDLRPSGQGALVFARWFAEASRHGAPTFVGVHVLEEAHLRAALRYHHLDELIAGAKEQAASMVSHAKATEILHEVHAVRGNVAEESLEAARVYHHARGIIVGRQAPREGHHLLRLGKVARRLLRNLAAPVVVVPPDWDPAEVGADGPVLCPTNLGPGTVGAAQFAGELAAQLDRPLMLLHVVPVPDDFGAQYIPKESRDKIAAECQADGTRDLAKWVEELGIAGVTQQMVRPGHVTEQVLAVAREVGASMIVTGSRRLSTIERWLLTSVGSELAATSPCPVAVVPPPGDER